MHDIVIDLSVNQSRGVQHAYYTAQKVFNYLNTGKTCVSFVVEQTLITTRFVLNKRFSLLTVCYSWDLFE